MDSTTFIRNSGNNENEWSARCQYWQLKSELPSKRKRRERETRGLILAGHGISISVNRGTLLIRNGNTHYPSKSSVTRLFKGDLSLPPRLVLIDGSGSITLDALDWMSEQRIDLIRLKWDSLINSVASTSGYSADRKRVEWQLGTRSNNAKRVEFASSLIKAKIKETLTNLETLLPSSPSREKAITNSRNALKALKVSPPKTISKLLAIEGTVAQGYFFAWRALQMKWKAVNRYPIPHEWKQYFARSSLAYNLRPGNMNATHPINAMLNYAYKLLESQTRVGTIADGYDPSIGIMHDRREPDRHSFVFDLMEPKRPIIDRAILKLIAEETFSGSDFILQKNGVCRLNPQLARSITLSSPTL